jgi:hypothetical protein
VPAVPWAGAGGGGIIKHTTAKSFPVGEKAHLKQTIRKALHRSPRPVQDTDVKNPGRASGSQGLKPGFLLGELADRRETWDIGDVTFCDKGSAGNLWT